ncbi:MAG TPA: YceI family protein [Longimicrobiaceae bacterium]|nr:YceI family protein [Longimicrobiaceae bacterium]
MKSTKAVLALPLLVASLAAPAGGRAQATRYELAPAESRIGFDASATMGRFGGRASRVSGWADVADSLTLAGTRGEVHVDAASFGTGIALRNRHLRDEMEVGRYPWIRFVLTNVTPSQGGGAMLQGRLTIKAETREVSIPATVARADGAITLDGRLPVKFTEYGMRPPSRMAGMTRVRDDLVLHFHAVFRRAGR